MPHLSRPVRSFTYLALVSAIAWLTPAATIRGQDVATSAPVEEIHARNDDTKKPIGHVIDGPANLRDFSPEDTGTLAIPADQIDLRKVFEDLGPDATLWYQHVQTLANPFFEGRAPGS